METLRERILELLMNRREPMTARQILELLEFDEKEGEKTVYSSMPHIAKTIKRRYGRTLNMIPPMCADCGFTFNKLRASRCPKCRSERITHARFFVR